MKINRQVVISVGVLVLSGLLISSLNYFRLQRHMNEAVSFYETGTVLRAHYGFFVNPTVLVLNMIRPGEESSRATNFYTLLKFSELVKDQEFSVVELQYNGSPRFLIKGDYFRKLGEEFSWQNPVYTLQHFPENLLNPDGSAAYPTWEGGWLGVSSKQLQDANDFHDKWYLDESLKN